ncbi:MAG: acylphosphatase [Ectothiorhodospiraceae bacterium]|nr:acylphosphatase [Ectothiorhodospiraceae bacterium]
MESIYVVISGSVQGVGFRHFARENARGLGLVGYVKNLQNGKVEVFAQGESSDLEKYVSQLKAGPISAHVTDTQITWKEIGKKYDEFKVAF